MANEYFYPSFNKGLPSYKEEPKAELLTQNDVKTIVDTYIKDMAKKLKNPLESYVEERTNKEFGEFLRYNEDLRFTKKMKELENKGVISVKANEPVYEEDVFSPETKIKAKYIGIGFAIGLLFAIFVL